MTMENIINTFKDEIRNQGMTPPDQIIPGKLIRFSDDGGKNKNGWCILNINPDGTAGAAFGNWKNTDKKWFYVPEGQQISKGQQNNFNLQILKAKRIADQKLKAKQANAANKANEIFKKAIPANPEHQYLVKKQIKPYGLKQYGKALIINILDDQEKITSLQEIFPNGTKKFLPGGKIKGGYSYIGNRDCDTFFIGEGFATMATIHAATRKFCIIAFCSGNLKLVSEFFKDKYPDKKIIIIADNDLATEKKTGINPGRKAATEAALAIGAELCICPVNSDFNDLQVSQGMNAVKQVIKKSKKISSEEWESPIPLDKNPTPMLDHQLLTGIIGDMAQAVSIETETPFELTAGLILSVLGTACQGKFVVKIKPGYQEPLNIWTVTALDPANRKSSVLMKITEPLTQWEKQKHSEFEPRIKEAVIKNKNQEARLKSLRGKLGRAKFDKIESIEKEIFEIETNLEEIPKFPKIWAQDVTPEHLGTLLHNHGEVMSILSAEGGIFEIIGGRYSNGVGNLDLFLQGHSGDPVRVDRGSREPVYLDSPALTLGLSPQPEVLRGLADKPGFRGKGLLARFLYFLPKSNLGYRGLDSDPVPENIKLNYQNLIFNLLDIEPVENDSGEKQKYILTLDQDSSNELADFSMVVEKELREGGRFEYITDWAGKLPGAAARIAGLLHCAKNPNQPWSKDIELETMEKALELSSVFASHALIAFDLMGADRSLDKARKVWRWVERGKFESFKKRDCFHNLQGTFMKVTNIEEPLSILVERNYIKAETKQTGGRPSVNYDVNPEIIEGWL